MRSNSVTRPGIYVMVDNKLRILAAMKEIRGDRLTTVFPRRDITRLSLKISRHIRRLT